jgi:1-acyl-sn-glycerol-3-phosphate acyltransferase
MALWLSGVRLEVHGLEKIPPGRAVIFMPNHQSNCDPPAMVVILPPVLVMAKREFFRVPVLGRGMRARGFIPVDRRNRERAIAAVEQAVAALKAGHSFLAYPEGTRSPDGRLQTFKKGVFVMAIKAGAPIVPISVSGGSKIMPKGKFVIRPGRVRITIHDPIPTANVRLDERQMVIDLTRQAILTGLAPEEWPA